MVNKIWDTILHLNDILIAMIQDRERFFEKTIQGNELIISVVFDDGFCLFIYSDDLKKD